MSRRFALLALAAALLPVAAPAAQQRVPVTGVVFDSVARAPLANALVQLAVSGDSSRDAHSVTTDSAGRFRAEVAPGSYLVGFYHPMLDSLGLRVPPRGIVVRGSAPVRADLGIPRATTIARTLCGERPRTDSTGVVIGHVFDAATDEPVGTATVTLQWFELVLEKRALAQQRPQVDVRTNDAGWFAVCGVPADAELVARAARGADSSGTIALLVPARELVRQDFFVSRVETVTIPGTDSVAPTVGAARGRALVTGTVRSVLGEPLDGATVLLHGGGAPVRTDDRGRFALRDAPAGTRILEARYLGFAPARQTVHVSERRPADVSITLETRVAVLDTIRVRTTVFARDRNGFEGRRRAGMGHFITPDDVARRNPIWTTDLFRVLPGVYMPPGSPSNQQVLMRNYQGISSEPFCYPDIYIDGMRLSGAEAATGLNLMAFPSEIAGIEVYSRPVQAPAQYSNPVSGCGSIVIWTRPAPPKPPKPKKSDEPAEAKRP